MSTQAGLMTVEEFLKLPDPQGGYYELRHGEAVFVTYPKWGHERRQGRITNLIKRLSCREGEVRMEMAFRPTQEHQLWRADVAFVRAERADAVGDDEFLIGAPELVVEVLSPSNTAVEIDDRRLVCLENGCSSFWVVNEKKKLLSVTECGLTRQYGVNDSFYCAVLDATIQVREIFE